MHYCITALCITCPPTAPTPGCPRSEMQPCITAMQCTAQCITCPPTAPTPGCPRSKMQPCVTAMQCTASHVLRLPRHLDVRDLKCNHALLQCNARHCTAPTMRYCNAMHGTALPRHLDVRDLKCNHALLQCYAMPCITTPSYSDSWVFQI